MPHWNPNFETGHVAIDAEHREFVRQLDLLKTAIDAGAGREKVVDLIVVLQHYVLGHFAREEAHMLRVGCPAHEANCAAHREFALKFDHWLELLTFAGTPVSLLLEVHHESLAWITRHILKVDCSLRACSVHDHPSDSSPSGPLSP